MAVFTKRPLSQEEVAVAINWARDEGWNPGKSDGIAFCATDPIGFWGGFLGEELVSTISVVNYDSWFSFLGFYITKPAYRGQGYGYQLWQHALVHAGKRCIGLDGVVDQQANYAKSGFELAWRNIRQQANLSEMKEALGSASASLGIPDDVEAFDRQHFPADRGNFLQKWFSLPGHTTAFSTNKGKLNGYATLRPCDDGYKIGPLFASTPKVATNVLAKLIQQIEKEPAETSIFLDTPEPNAAALELASTCKMEPVFETARMYKGAQPDIRLKNIFGITTFELG